MQVSYLKTSPYLFHPISTYFPLIKSKFLATPNTFYLQHLPHRTLLLQGLRPASALTFPWKTWSQHCLGWCKLCGRTKPVRGYVVTTHRHLVFWGQTNTPQLDDGGWIHIQLTCTYSQLRTTSTNSDCKGTTEIQYTIFCMMRGSFPFPRQRRAPIWQVQALLLLLRLGGATELQPPSCTHTPANKHTKHAELLLLLLSWRKEGIPAESFKHKPASSVSNTWLLLVSKCN